MNRSEYYQKVGDYYDEDAPRFEERYWANETLQKIRSDFRLITEQYSFNTALEIGFGPGVDLEYFALKYPEKSIYGIDISKGMFDYAEKQLQSKNIQNVKIGVGSVEDVTTLFPGVQYDLIFVYFGALNTVANLSDAAAHLEKLLKPNGKIIITVINKWYLSGMILPMIKGKFSIAFRRLQKVWGGYSPHRTLESKCYSPKEVKQAFKPFRLIRKKGYSITYPAWYQDNMRKRLSKLYPTLWKIDQLLNKTPLWSLGEYTLFVFEKR